MALDLALRSWHTINTAEADLAVVHAFAQLLAKLEGHTGAVGHAAFSPDGQRIVTAGFGNTARVYRVLTLSDIAELLAN